MNESHMLTEVMRRLGKILASALAIDNQILSSAVALAGHLRGAIRQQLDVAVEDDGNRLVDPAIALGQLGLGLPRRSRLRPHARQPVHRSPVQKPLPRTTLLLLPLQYPFHHRGGVVPGRWGGSSSSAAVVFQHDSALFCARPCGVIALSALPLGYRPGGCLLPGSVIVMLYYKYTLLNKLNQHYRIKFTI